MIERIAPTYPAQLTKEFCQIGFLIGGWCKAESVHQYLGMVVVDRSTELAAPCDVVWEAVKTREAFRTVTRGLLVMPVIKEREESWRVGETVIGWVFLFGFIPFARHHLHVAAIDNQTRTLSSRERGGILKRWDHDIIVTPIDQHRCLYRDRIEIEAGFLTPFVGLYARWFYSTRQHRWRALARRLGNA